MRVAGIGKLSWLVVLMLSMAIVAACGAETRTSCSFCGQSDMPNVIIGYEDLRESAKDTLDVDIRVESGEGHVIDLKDEKFHFWNACPLRFPKRLNCQYGFNTSALDKTITVRMTADGKSYEQEYSTRGFEAPCPRGVGYIKITRDETGYQLAKEATLVTECEENP